jgi:biotin carboxyl carrier protein
MKLKAELAGQEHELILQRDGASVTAQVDGRHYSLEIQGSATGEYLLLEGTRVHNCRVETRPNQLETYVVHVAARSYEIQVTDPRRLRSAQSSGAHHHGSAEIIASMPGKVVRVMVEVGAQVEAGAGILVVEAMKMQNEMKAPKAGRVIELNADPGATVNVGDVLAVIE